MVEERIIIFRVGSLGDTLVALPAIRAIRDAHPDAALCLLTDETQDRMSAWEVLQGTDWFEQVISFRPKRFFESLSLARTIRKISPQRLYYLPPARRTRFQVARDWIFFRVICKVGKCIGLRPRYAYISRGERSANRVPKEYAALLNWISSDLPHAPAIGDGKILPIRCDWRDVARKRLASLTTNAAFIAIAPASNMPATQWPEERYEKLGRILIEKNPEIRLLILGGASDRQLGQRLCKSWGRSATNLAGELSVGESAAVLEQCRLYVGNDTGTMHLASAVGTQCIVVSSARTIPGQWEPWGEQHVILRQNVPCAGCGLQVCTHYENKCLTEITVETVAAAISAELKRNTSLKDAPTRLVAAV